MNLKKHIATLIISSLFCINLVEAKMNQIITLPKPILDKSISVDEAITHRRSIRQFSSKPLTLAQIAKLLWAAQGITDTKQDFRAAPSAGALYPLELYLLNNAGVWHYLVKQHALELLSTKDLRTELPAAAYGQNFIAKAPIVIVITAIYARETVKYGERGIRFSNMEAGHAAENIELEAINLGLVSIPVGGFKDEAVHQLLNLPKDAMPLYLIPIGYKQ